MAKKSRQHIADFLAQGPAYVAVSWGKDSVVMLDLAMDVDPSVQVVWARARNLGNPDCLFVRDVALGRWPMRYVEFDVDDCDPAAWQARWGTMAQLYGQRRITGVRASESSDRAMSQRVHGVSTERSCRPILGWSAQDVWAWLALRDLPTHPAYAMTGGGALSRDGIRVAVLWDERFLDERFGRHRIHRARGQGHGRLEWERMYYGDVLSRQH